MYRSKAKSLFACTAIFAGNDLSALGALDAIDHAGLDVPGDVSLIGYDNTSVAALRHVDLTSVDQGRERLGALAIEALIERHDDGIFVIGLDLVAIQIVRIPGIVGYFAYADDVGVEELAEGFDVLGDILRIVAQSPGTGYTGWTDVVVPALAAAGSSDLPVDLILYPPEAAIAVRRTFLEEDETGETQRVTQPVADGGRTTNADDYVEIATRFTVRGEVPPKIPGLALHGRYAAQSNLGETDIRFPVPAGDSSRVLELRSAFPASRAL